jgi:hypothetical protein
MPPTPSIQLPKKEGRILLAKQAIQKDQFPSHRKAAETFGISRIDAPAPH